MRSYVWLSEVDHFRTTEQIFLEDDRYLESLQEHRQLLAGLIAQGEAIVLNASRFGLPDDFTGFTKDDLISAVRSLQISFNCQHGPKSHPAVKDEIQRLFDVEKSEN